MTRLMIEKGRLGHGVCIPERSAAARAGVTTYEKNTFAFAQGIGSFIYLS